MKHREQATGFHHEKPELHHAPSACQLEKQLRYGRYHQTAAEGDKLVWILVSGKSARNDEPIRTHRGRLRRTQLQWQWNSHQVAFCPQADHARRMALIRAGPGQKSIKPLALLRAVVEDRWVDPSAHHLQWRPIIRKRTHTMQYRHTFPNPQALKAQRPASTRLRRPAVEITHGNEKCCS